MPTKIEMMEFEKSIEVIVSEKQINYIEAIIHYCTQFGVEVDVAATLTSKSLKAKLANDAEGLNLLPKRKKLPI